MDLHEDAKNNVVTATFELPGLKKEDVQIDVHNGRLTITGESKVSEEHETDGYAVRERSFGEFSRTLRLPQNVKVRIKHVNYDIDTDVSVTGGRDQSISGGRYLDCHVPQGSQGRCSKENYHFLNLIPKELWLWNFQAGLARTL